MREIILAEGEINSSYFSYFPYWGKGHLQFNALNIRGFKKAKTVHENYGNENAKFKLILEIDNEQ